MTRERWDPNTTITRDEGAGIFYYNLSGILSANATDWIQSVAFAERNSFSERDGRLYRNTMTMEVVSTSARLRLSVPRRETCQRPNFPQEDGVVSVPLLPAGGRRQRPTSSRRRTASASHSRKRNKDFLPE